MPKFVDLTLTLSGEMRGVAFEQSHTLERDGWNAKILHLYSHSGTHMDAPLHYGTSDVAIDQIPIEKCILNARVADCTAVKPRELISVDHLGNVATQIRKGEGLLIRTGWSHFLGEPSYRDQVPGVSQALARFCVRKGVALVGVEPPAVADVHNIQELQEVHRILLKAGVIILEGLTNLESISQGLVKLIALPLKIRHGDGSPARVIVIEE